MAKILSFGNLAEEEKEKQERIARNQKHLENLASGSIDDADKQLSGMPVFMIPAGKFPEGINPQSASYEDIVEMLKMSIRNTSSIPDLLKSVEPKSSLLPFDWSNRIKAFDHSIIPFENPVIRFTPEVKTTSNGIIGLLADQRNHDDPVACLYYRNSYLFASQWDFCLFMAGTPKYKHFYTLLLSLKDTNSRCAYMNKVLTAVRKNEEFTSGVITRTAFVENALSASSKLEDFIAFSSMCQYAVEKALNDKFVIL